LSRRIRQRAGGGDATLEQLAILARLPVPRLANRARVFNRRVRRSGGLVRRPVGDLAHRLHLPLGGAAGRAAACLLERTAARGRFCRATRTALAEELAARARGLSARQQHSLFVAARRAVAVRDEFLAVASHDMKSPLGAILYLGVAAGARQGTGDDWDRVRRAGDSNPGGGRDHGSAETHDLVDMAALDAGRLSMTHGEHEGRASSSPPPPSSSSPWRPSARGASEIEAEPELVVRVDRGRILQALGNLTATPCAIRTRAATVRLTAALQGSEV
jgi:signal transduction histidine kinase